MPKQLLIIDPPDQLTFYGPFNDKCCSYLNVTNPSPYTVCYKVKTTATHRYYVKPKMGMILPYSQQTLQFKLKAGIGEKVDKFKIQSAISPNTNCADLCLLWNLIRSEDIMQTKLATNFVGESKFHGTSSVIKKEERTSRWRDVLHIYILFIIGYLVISFLFIQT